MRARCERALRRSSFRMTETVIADCVNLLAVSIMTGLASGQRFPNARKNSILVKCTVQRNHFVSQGITSIRRRAIRLELSTRSRRKAITRKAARRYSAMWDNKETSGDVIIEEKTENPDEIVITRLANEEPKPNSFTDDLASS